MKASIDREEFLRILKPSAAVSDHKSPMDSLAHVRLIGSGKDIEAVSTSLTAWAIGTAPAVLKDGAEIDGFDMMFPAKQLLSMVSSMPGKKVNLTIDNPPSCTLTMQSGKTRYRLQGGNVTSFPRTPAVLGSATDIEGGALRDLFKLVLPFVAKDESSVGYWMIIEGSDLGPGVDAFATDGHSAVWAKADDLGLGLNKGNDWILPRGSVSTIAKVMPGGPLELRRAKHLVSLKNEVLQLIFPTSTASPPNVRQLFDGDQGKHVAIVDRELLLETIHRAEATGGEQLVLEFSKGTVSVESANSMKGGDFHDEISCEYTGGDGLRIGVAPSLMTRALNSLDGVQASIRAEGPLCPLFVTAADSDTTRTVVMPMRIGE